MNNFPELNIQIKVYFPINLLIMNFELVKKTNKKTPNTKGARNKFSNFFLE